MDEAEGAVDLYIAEIRRAECLANDFHLAFDALDKLRAVATCDPQLSTTWREQASGPLDSHLPLVVLGVDDSDAAGPDRDVIQVRSRAGDQPIVKQPDALSGEMLLEPLRRTGLSRF